VRVREERRVVIETFSGVWGDTLAEERNGHSGGVFFLLCILQVMPTIAPERGV